MCESGVLIGLCTHDTSWSICIDLSMVRTTQNNSLIFQPISKLQVLTDF